MRRRPIAIEQDRGLEVAHVVPSRLDGRSLDGVQEPPAHHASAAGTPARRELQHRTSFKRPPSVRCKRRPPGILLSFKKNYRLRKKFDGDYLNGKSRDGFSFPKATQQWGSDYRILGHGAHTPEANVSFAVCGPPGFMAGPACRYKVVWSLYSILIGPGGPGLGVQRF